MKAVVATFNQEKALVGAFSVIMNLRMELFQALVQTFDLTRATDYYGHFSCPAAEEEGSVYGLTSTKLYYETYHVAEVSSRHKTGDEHCLYYFQDGNLVASHPGVVHTFEKDKFCLVYLQVHIVNTDRDTLAPRPRRSTPPGGRRRTWR